jgi:dinuclear metal center YbgI/SA1388 family protein
MSAQKRSMTRGDLGALLDEWLQPARFTDVAENGLQVEGNDVVTKVVTGVSANRAFIEQAIDVGADAIVVHHGLVWGGGIRRLDGWLKERVRLLLQHGINLFAYHLPLDAHPQFGNNAGLARALGLVATTPFGRYKGQLIGLQGALSPRATLPGLVERARKNVTGDGVVHAFGDPKRELSSIGLCTGGAPDLLHEAVAAGLDVYVTGEVTEYVKAVADESGVCFVGLGHHATERFGPRALADALRTHGLDADFVDVENPA